MPRLFLFLFSLIALWPAAGQKVFAQIPTPTINLLDTLIARKNFEGKETYIKIWKLAHNNRSNGIFTISLEMLLRTAINKASDGRCDSLGATSTKFCVYGDSGGAERSLFLSPLGGNGAQFMIIIKGDTATAAITPSSSYDDLMRLKEKLYLFFGDVVDMGRLFDKKTSPPSPVVPGHRETAEPGG
jgi:hypothetical protein